MKTRHHTGETKQICLPCIVFLLAVLRQCHSIDGQNNFNNTVSCAENEYEHNGFCCDKCPPGFKLSEKCLGKDLRSKCVRCSSETFQDNMNHFQNCFLCKKPCDSAAKEIEIEPCTHMKDRKCGCQDGYYQKKLNDITMSCEPCRKCGNGERETSPCLGDMNRVCECRHNHYRVAKRVCAQCTNCSSQCSDHCLSDKPTEPSLHTPGSHLQTTFVLGWVCLCVMMGLICIISSYIGFQHWKKRKETVCSESPMPYDPEKQVGKIETRTCLQNEEAELSLLAAQLDPVLPDCIPREIKTHEFIYFVLDNVPVGRFKELVRRLNVSEQDISRAERDNRAFADAQYQMLMFWVDSGSRGGKNILSRPLLQECLDSLKLMNLTACAESIEEKYA